MGDSWDAAGKVKSDLCLAPSWLVRFHDDAADFSRCVHSAVDVQYLYSPKHKCVSNLKGSGGRLIRITGGNCVFLSCARRMYIRREMVYIAERNTKRKAVIEFS